MTDLRYLGIFSISENMSKHVWICAKIGGPLYESHPNLDRIQFYEILVLSEYIPILFIQYSAVSSIGSIACHEMSIISIQIPQNCWKYLRNSMNVLEMEWISQYKQHIKWQIQAEMTQIWYKYCTNKYNISHLIDILWHAIDPIDETAEYWRNRIGMYSESTRIS